MPSNFNDLMKIYFSGDIEFVDSLNKLDEISFENDPVNHPKHYQSKTGLEVIDVIEAFTDGLEGIEATDTGNIIKYVCRWKEKGSIQDLKKIIWYANHLIEHLERKENK